MDLETQVKLTVALFLLSCALIFYIIYVYGDNRTVQRITVISIFLMLLFGTAFPEIELQDTFNKTVSDKYIEDSPIPFSEKKFYVFEFTEHPFKKRHVNESDYNKYEIGDKYTLVVVYEEW